MQNLSCMFLLKFHRQTNLLRTINGCARRPCPQLWTLHHLLTLCMVIHAFFIFPYLTSVSSCILQQLLACKRTDVNPCFIIVFILTRSSRFPLQRDGQNAQENRSGSRIFTSALNSGNYSRCSFRNRSCQGTLRPKRSQ